MKARFLDTGAKSAAMNMAIDEVLMGYVSQSGEPIIRLYSWSPHAVSLGFFQSAEQELDLGECKKQGVDVVRRLTGGGAVFHDKEITYSLIIPESSQVPKDILESYNFICGAIVQALKSLGLCAKFHPINDILVNGKKISGNAQTRRNGIILQHGTILLDVDVDKMFSLLRVPDEKLRDKGIVSAKERVTSLKSEIEKVSIDDIKSALRKNFNGLGLELYDSSLSQSELKSSLELSENKYSKAEWNLMR
jgi:lipoate---protein ligase